MKGPWGKVSDLPVAEDVKRIAAQGREQPRMKAVPAQTRIQQPLGTPKASDAVEIELSDDHLLTNERRKDSKFSQIVRNHKSHKTCKSNFIYQGYAEEIAGGFRITAKGMNFVWDYFKDRP